MNAMEDLDGKWQNAPITGVKNTIKSSGDNSNVDLLQSLQDTHAPGHHAYNPGAKDGPLIQGCGKSHPTISLFREPPRWQQDKRQGAGESYF